MVASLPFLSDETREDTLRDCHRAKVWGKNTGGDVSISAAGGQYEGTESSPGSAVVWEPSCGAVALYIQEEDQLPFETASLLLLSFRVAFMKRQEFWLSVAAPFSNQLG